MKKRRMPKATPALTKQKIFLELKKPDEFIVKNPKNTRDVAGFERICAASWCCDVLWCCGAVS